MGYAACQGDLYDHNVISPLNIQIVRMVDQMIRVTNSLRHTSSLLPISI